MGNNTPKKGPELQLLGLKGLDIRDVDNEGKKDIENNDTDTASRIRQAVDYEAEEDILRLSTQQGNTQQDNTEAAARFSSLSCH